MFFNDFAWNDDKTFLFSCDKCIRRWNINEKFSDHLINQHDVDSYFSSYTSQVHHVTLYSSIARDYLKISIMISNDLKREICIDIEIIISLIDNKLMKIFNLTSQNIKSINFNDVNNQVTSNYINYQLIIDRETINVQSYVVDKFKIDILLSVDTIEDYAIDIITIKKVIFIDINEMFFNFDRINDILINYAIIALFNQSFEVTNVINSKQYQNWNQNDYSIKRALLNQSSKISRNSLKINSFKSTLFKINDNSTLRISMSSILLKQKTSKIFFTKTTYQCHRCFRIFDFNNRLHEHVINTHFQLRHRRFFERNINAHNKFDDLWRKL